MSDEQQGSLADRDMKIRATGNVFPFDRGHLLSTPSPTVYRMANSRVRAETAEPYFKVTVENPAEDINMAEFTRGEFDARLEAAEMRTNARVAGIEADIKIISNSISNISSDIKDIKNNQSNTKSLILGSIIATGVALTALVLALFTYGKDMFELALTLTQVRP